MAAIVAAGSILLAAVVFMPSANAEIVRRDFYFHGGDIGGAGVGAISVQGTMDESIGTSEKTAWVPSTTGNIMSLTAGLEAPKDTSAYPIAFTSDPLADDLVICPGTKKFNDGDWIVSAHISVINCIQSATAGYWTCGIFEIKPDGTYVPVAYTPGTKVFATTSLSGYAEGTYPVEYAAGPESNTYTFTKGSRIAIGIQPEAYVGAVICLFGYDSEVNAARIRFDSVVGDIGGIVMTTANHEKSIHAGERIVYTINVTNTCGLDQPVVLKATDAPPGWDAVLSDTKFDLAANESKEVTLSINASLDSIEGDEAKVAVKAAYEFGASFLNTTTTVVNHTIDTSNQDVLPQGEEETAKTPGFEIFGLIAAICVSILLSRGEKG